MEYYTRRELLLAKGCLSVEDGTHVRRLNREKFVKSPVEGI